MCILCICMHLVFVCVSLCKCVCLCLCLHVFNVRGEGGGTLETVEACVEKSGWVGITRSISCVEHERANLWFPQANERLL